MDDRQSQPNGDVTKGQDADATAARQRLRDLLDGALPDTTGDERDDADTTGFSDEDFLRERPPHHGG